MGYEQVDEKVDTFKLSLTLTRGEKKAAKQREGQKEEKLPNLERNISCVFFFHFLLCFLEAFSSSKYFAFKINLVLLILEFLLIWEK